jgi:23S rRNA (adenine-N6)-dimethyltransferase
MVYHDPNSLSQNFIKSRCLVEELLTEINIDSRSLVIEIGPGKGIITEQLIKIAGMVITVEKDELLCQGLREKFKDCQNLKIYHEDFLEFNLPHKPFVVVANIPFAITAKIMNKLLTEQMPEAMYLIMQMEVAEKFIGKYGETQSSMLTKPWYEIEILGEIDRTSFTLKPQIKIVLVKFIKRKNVYIRDESKSHYRNFIFYGFNQWQPTVSEAFKKVMSFAQRKRFEKVYKIDKLKPSELNFDNWLLMFKNFDKIVNEEQKRIMKSFKART